MTGSRIDSRQSWVALAICFCASVVIFLPYVGYSTQTAQMMSDLTMDYTMVGTLASATALSGGIVVCLAGGLLNRWGIKNVCLAGLVMSAIGQCLFAIAPSYHVMLIVRILQGGAIPLLFLGPYTLAMHWGEATKRLGVFMGVMLSTDGIGTVVASYGYAEVLNQWGWRTGSVIGAGIIIVVTLLVWLLLKEPGQPAIPAPAQNQENNRNSGQYIAVLTTTNVIIASFFLIGVWGSFSVAVFWVPTLLIQEAKWGESAAGFIGALYPLAGVISAVSFGVLSDRFGTRKPLMLASGTGMMLASIVAALAISHHRFDVLALTLPIGGISAYTGLPLAYCIAADAVGLELAGTATGCIMAAGLVLGGMLYPFVLGYVRDATGNYTLGFGIAAASLLVCNIIPVLFVKEKSELEVLGREVTC